MLKILKYVWAIYFLAWFTIIFLLFYPFFLVLLSRELWYPKAHSLRRVWGRLLLLLSGIRSEVTYDEALDKAKTYVFTPNHFSYFDIVSVNTLMPFYFSFMAKKELTNIPLFKIFFKTIDIPVDRHSITGAREAYRQAHKKLDKGISLLNFPEGGIGPQVPKMRKFKMGAFKLAIDQGIEVVPITILDNWKRLPSGGLLEGGSPGKMRMHIHRPIPTDNLKPGDEQDIADKVYRIIEEKFNSVNNLK